jgi:hypothetical protein
MKKIFKNVLQIYEFFFKQAKIEFIYNNKKPWSAQGCQAEPQMCTIVNTSRHMLADAQTNKRARPPYSGEPVQGMVWL